MIHVLLLGYHQSVDLLLYILVEEKQAIYFNNFREIATTYDLCCCLCT